MADLWGDFAHDPRDPAHASLRVSDRDRDLVLSALGDAFADGRLDREEFDQRSDGVTAARTLGDLPALVADLSPSASLVSRGSHTAPLDLRQQAEEKYGRTRREAVWGLLSASVICWVIWAATGASYPWPLWVMLGTGLNVGRVLFQHREIVADEVVRLQREADEIRPDALEKPAADSQPDTQPDT